MKKTDSLDNSIQLDKQVNDALTKTQQLTQPSGFWSFWLNFSANKGAVLGLIFIVIIVFAAVFAPWIAPHDPIEQFRSYLRVPPAWTEKGTSQFLLGTDEAGRDIFSRIIHGGRLSLFIAACAVIFALVPGVILGLLAAFFPRSLGSVIMRIVDVMLSLPTLLLAVAIMAILGQGLLNAMIAIAIASLPAYVRLTRATAMTELNKEYVLAARVAGAGALRLMFITLLPNCLAPLIVQMTMSFSSAILEIAALGFLGLGVKPPSPEWGTMLASAREYITQSSWIVTYPGLTILLSVISINLIGDGLRDALDPKLKQAS